MKKITLLCVGKIKEKYFTDGINEYAKRLSRFCDFTVKELAECPHPELAVKAESDELLKAAEGYVILFDLGGKALSSPQLSEAVERAFAAGAARVTFVVGGSLGVDERVKKRADIMVAFGQATFPHQLMRLMAAEQIYRAACIAAGTPYHK